MLGESHRNNRNALNIRTKFCKLGNAVFQLLSIVISRTQHDLGIDLDSTFGKHLHKFECFPRKRVFHHLNAKLRVHGVHRNVDWTDMHLDDAADVVLF